ncbi:MAG: hypothetical protein RLZZ502_1662 [Pseudomonadota bacterium]|jgi:cytochrome c oxidase assembly protein subunit 11
MSLLKSENWALLRKLAVFAVVMFGFGYAMVPLYNAFCKLTGVRNLLKPDVVAENTQVDQTRTVTIEFDSNVRQLPWQFKPQATQLKVHPGALTQVNYDITNEQARRMTGQAVPSYGPKHAAEYFKKIDCFCFEKKTLMAGETRSMPVVFVIDPKLPKDIHTITLSYTFFEVEGNG